MTDTRLIYAATYNTHRCLGVDGKRDPERIARVLNSTPFDLVGLQEVESGDGDLHQLSLLAERTQSKPIPGPTMFTSDSDYGNALLVRGEVEGTSHHDLSVEGREPRGVLEVMVTIDGLQLRCLVTHLGLGLAERRWQMDRLLQIARAECRGPTVLLGDFNEWLPFTRSRARLKRHFGKIPTPATFPAWFPMFALDHIWVRPPDALRQLHVVNTSLAKRASDHLPVLSRIELRPPSD
jgi:endonuclease/exonuclease/phosphatase family metal-dependent hydrolase